MNIGRATLHKTIFTLIPLFVVMSTMPELINASTIVPEAIRSRNYDFLKARECRGSIYLQTSDNKAVKGVLLSIRHFATSSLSTPQGGRVSYYNSSYGESKRKFQSSGTFYDRICTFGDLEDENGRCFAIVLKSASHSDHFFTYAKKGSSVGDVFVILEAEVENFLSPEVPILVCREPAIPLRFDVGNIPNIGFQRAEMGNTRYFAAHEVRVRLNNVSVMDSQTVSCNGRLCDRQLPRSQMARGKVACGCLYTQKMPGWVLEGRLMIDTSASFATYAEEFNVTGDIAVLDGPLGNHEIGRVFIKNYRSWRISMLCIEDFEILDPSRVQQLVLHGCVSDLFSYVNEHGGWTIVGWHRPGSVQDASSGDHIDTVGSETQKLHVALLYPTNSNLPAMMAFKNLKYISSNQSAEERNENDESSTS